MAAFWVLAILLACWTPCTDAMLNGPRRREALSLAMKEKGFDITNMALPSINLDVPVPLVSKLFDKH